MAAPITHIVLANKIFSKEFSNLSKEKFFVGTSFPDIRYLGLIERKETHYINLTLEEIKNVTNDAIAGMMFHSLVDEVREKFMEETGIYKVIAKNGISIQSLKLFEDEILYGQIKDWESVAAYFNSILPEESAYPISEDGITRWHNVLKTYFTEGPDKESRKLLFKEINFSDENVSKLEENIADMKQNSKIIEIVNNFYNKFGEEIK